MMATKKRKAFFLKTLAITLLCIGTIGLLPLPAVGLVKTVAQRTNVTVYSNDKASVDASNLSEGYVIVRYTGGRDIRIKAQITKRDGTTYTYDINAKGDPEVLPLTEGDGRYTISVFENISGTRYSQAYSTSVEMRLRDQLLPFLYPNQYVNYKERSPVADKAKELVEGETEQLTMVANIYHYVTKNLTYDRELARRVQPGYLPDVDAVLERKKGICFDYAALMSSMLRLNGVPCKLVIGYAGQVYHAWINVYIEEVGWIDQAIFFDGEKWSLMDPTFVSTSNSPNAVRQFVGEGNNYSEKYVY